MKMMVFVIGTALILQACSYSISPDLANQADKNIPFGQLKTDPELYKGKLVILGGSITQTANTDHSTLIEVDQKSLDHWGKPMNTGQSAGRFLVLYTGYLDPLVFSPGRDITVAAVVEGILRKGLGDEVNSYPVILSKELKLWPRERQSWNKPQYLDPLYDPYTSPRHY